MCAISVRRVPRELSDKHLQNNKTTIATLETNLENDDADIELAIREDADTVYHPVGTCKMGSVNDTLAVVDPSLKVLHRQVQREFFKHRQSKKWRKLKSKFKRRKRKAVKLFYSKFVNELKDTDPGRWYKMAQRIGAVDQMNEGEVSLEQLEGIK